MLKKQNKASRVIKGNKQAESVRKYLNHRCNTSFVDFSGTERDKHDGEDFGNENVTMQCKVRASGEDTIFESDQYYPSQEGGFHYSHKPGRDARTKATYYVCKPVKENCLTFPFTKTVKEIVQKVTEEWGVLTSKGVTYNGVECNLIDLTTEELKNLWSKATCKYNKSIVAFVSEAYKGVMVYFKLEEGDKNKYGKLLFYIPISVTKGKTLYLKEGENVFDEGSWK